MAELSIVVPIYNGERTLEKCIDSILAQTYTDFELILVDDGSTDRTLEICREYERSDSRIKVLHQNNSGVVAARKNGVSMASSLYIGFVDSDDFIEPDMYSTLMGEALAGRADVATCGMQVDFGHRTLPVYHRFTEGYYGKDDIQSSIIPDMLIGSRFGEFGLIPALWLKVFRADIIREAMLRVPDDITVGEDVAITAYAATMADSLSIIDAVPYHYVQTDSSAVRSFNPNRIEAINALYNCLLQIDSVAYRKQIPLYISFMVFCAIAECIQRSGYTEREVRKYVRSILQNDVAIRTLSKVDTSRLRFKDKAKISLMKHRAAGILHLLISR